MNNIYQFHNERRLNGGARWAREEEIRQIAHEAHLNNISQSGLGGLPLISDGSTVYVDNSDNHNLIIGSTGSKKTRLCVMPMLTIFMNSGESVIVTDPKGELYAHTAGAFENHGYAVDVINLREPLHSNGWNPLSLAREYQNAGDNDKASSIINDFSCTFISENPNSRADPFWTHTARSMLQGLTHMLVEGISYFKDDEVNILNLRALSDNLNLEHSYCEMSTFDLLDSYPEDSLARYNLNAIKRGSEKTFDNIKVSYDASMQRLYIQQSLIRMLSVNEVNFQKYGNRKSVLFLILPDEKTTLHPIASLIIKQCYEQLIDTAQNCPNHSLPIRVNFLLDEFSNLPAIPDMPSMISAARSRNIRFHLVIQGLYQLSSKYGTDDAHTIKGNCGNWVFLTSREFPLLDEISTLCGVDAITGERLISVSQLQRLNKEKGEVLMLIGRQYPYIAHLPDISQYKVLKSVDKTLPILTSHNTLLSFDDICTIISKKYFSPDSNECCSVIDDDDDEETLDDDTIQKILEEKFEKLFGRYTANTDA